MPLSNFKKCSSAAAYNGMHRNQEDHMRSPFAQPNMSSSSLEGMERPVRSFKSFIKTVPPHPTVTQKPLPPTPSQLASLQNKLNQLPPSPTSPTSSSCVAPWKAPADWYESLPTPPLLSNRTLSPLLPDPSPTISDMEKSSRLGSNPQPARLLPISERPNGNADLGPPHSPPLSPLPAPPTSIGRSDEDLLSAERESGGDSPSAIKMSFFDIDLRHHTASPANSVHTSFTSNAPTKEKAFASLGIDPPRQQSVLENKLQDPPSMPSVERTRADQQFLRDKKLRALNKGSPLVDDSWEDTEMDDKMRQLSFSQDYHDLLADQYQEMTVHAEEVLSSGGAHQVYEARLNEPKPKSAPKDDELIPRPLSWQKGSGHSTAPVLGRDLSRNPSRNASPGAAAEAPSDSFQEKVHKRITSWVPHRPSVASRRQSLQRQPNELFEKKATTPKQKKSAEAGVDNIMNEELRFSKFFPASKPLKFGRKKKQTKRTQATKASTPRSTTPLIRLPGGLAVVRHTPSPVPRSEAASVSVPSPTSAHAPSNSQSNSDHSPISNSDNRSSRSPVAPGMAIRTHFRISGTSSRSHQSGNSSSSHPLSQEVAQSPRTPPPPPPPPQPSSSPHTPPLAPEAWNRFKSHTKDGDHHFKSGLIEKAKRARQKHNRDARQERLKKSIRVLGPTDPGVVAGYIKGEGKEAVVEREVDGGPRRLPGYMASGSV